MKHKKKFKSFESLGEFVYSTNASIEYKKETRDIKPAHLQNIEVHLEKKGRGGKTVTVIKGFEENDDQIKTLGKRLKVKCGTGGSVKNKEIIIQGDFRSRIIGFLQEEGFAAKSVGG